MNGEQIKLKKVNKTDYLLENQLLPIRITTA